LPELVAKEITPPFPTLPVVDNEDEFKSELSREISPELVAKEITPPFPTLPEIEYKYEYEYEDEFIELKLSGALLPSTTMSPRPYTRISPPFAPVFLVLVSTFPRMDIVPGKVLGLN
jgi:hypothetical protein